MNLFDKICAVPTIAVGAIFMALGTVGLIFGSNANFVLPPILGGLPFFLGWAMCVVLIKYWRQSARLKNSNQSGAYQPGINQPDISQPDINQPDINQFGTASIYPGPTKTEE